MKNLKLKNKESNLLKLNSRKAEKYLNWTPILNFKDSVNLVNTRIDDLLYKFDEMDAKKKNKQHTTRTANANNGKDKYATTTTANQSKQRE